MVRTIVAGTLALVVMGGLMGMASSRVEQALTVVTDPWCGDAQIMAQDGSCVDHGPVEEDEEGWDCRVMGNQTCGVEIEGVRYLVTFEDGLPTGVTTR